MRFSIRRFGVLLTAGLAALYLYAMGDLYFNQTRHVYHPVKEWATTPQESLGLAFEELTLTSSDGVKLSAWHVPVENPKGTVLVLHGNARNMSSDLDVIEMFHELRYDVLLVDYRGFGKSEGRPDEYGTYLDAQAAWDWLIGFKKESADRIVICGRSLGGAVGAELASRNRPRALMIEGSFTSLPEVGQDIYPFFPVKLLSRFDYDTLQKLKKTECPVLIIHSRDDEIVPFEHAQKLYEAAPGKKTLIEIGGPHKGGFEPTLRKYYDGVRDFLESASSG